MVDRVLWAKLWSHKRGEALNLKGDLRTGFSWTLMAFFSVFDYHLLISVWGGEVYPIFPLEKKPFEIFGLPFFKICMNQSELVGTGWNPFEWVWISLGLLEYVSVFSGSDKFCDSSLEQRSILSKWIEETWAWIEVDWTLVQLPWFQPSAHWLWVGCSALCVQLIFFHVRPEIG